MSSHKVWLSEPVFSAAVIVTLYSLWPTTVTGAATGIGFATAKAVLAHGDIVIGTVNRNRSKRIESLASRYSGKLHVLTADMSKQEDDSRIFAFAQKEIGRLDVVCNNAAIGGNTEVESHLEELARRMFEVNFWGMTYVFKEAVRFFREVNLPGAGGRLLQISSIFGIISMSLSGFYAAW